MPTDTERLDWLLGELGRPYSLHLWYNPVLVRSREHSHRSWGLDRVHGETVTEYGTGRSAREAIDEAMRRKERE